MAWDSFTHDDGWGTEHVALLRDSYLGAAGYDWAQHLCSVLGLVVVTVAALRYLARLPEQPPRPGPLVARWALVVALAWGGLLGMGIAVLVWPVGPRGDGLLRRDHHRCWSPGSAPPASACGGRSSADGGRVAGRGPTAASSRQE